MPEPTISIAIITDATQAAAGFADAAGALDTVAASARDASGKIDSASGAMRDLAADADTGASKARDMSGALDSVDSTAGGLTSGLRDMSDAIGMMGFEGLSTAMTTAAVGFEAISGATTLYNTVSGMTTKILGGVSKAFNFLKVTILSNPIFWIAAVIIGIVAAFIMLYKKCETFRKIVDAVFRFAWNLIKGFWNWIKSAFTTLIEFLRKPFDIWVSVVRTVIGIVRSVIAGVIAWIRGAVQAIATAWDNVFNAVVGFVKAAIQKVKNIIVSIVSTIRGIVDTIKNVFSSIFDAIKAPFEKAMNWVKDHFKLPSIDLNPFDGKSAPAMAAPSVGPRQTGARAQAQSSGVVINITGPISTHDTVRELRRLFREDQARLGRPVSSRVAVA